MGAFLVLVSGIVLALVGRALLRRAKRVHPQSAEHDACLYFGWLVLIGGLVLGLNGAAQVYHFLATVQASQVVIPPIALPAAVSVRGFWHGVLTCGVGGIVLGLLLMMTAGIGKDFIYHIAGVVIGGVVIVVGIIGVAIGGFAVLLGYP